MIAPAPARAELEAPPLAEDIRRWLAEDVGDGDRTTDAIVPAEARATATLVVREPGVVAGLGLARQVFGALDPDLRWEPIAADGERVLPGAVGRLEARARAVLTGERLALNLLGRLSGIATLTRRYVDAVAGTRAVILDTRKTTPGLRALEKYAVRCGGGTNHRGNLAEMAMIKDNHREALAGEGRSLAEGVAAIRALRPGIPVEVEIDRLDELEAALEGQPEWILLDNMSPAEMAEAVRRTAGRAKLEASGGVRLGTVAEIARTGVDAISVGALTHSAGALDIGLDLTF